MKKIFLFILALLALLLLLLAPLARADEQAKIAEEAPKTASVLPFVTKAMHQLDPKNEHVVMAQAVADVVDSDTPIFKDDASKLRTAALVVAVAWREGNLRVSVDGDCSSSKPGEKCVGSIGSYCTMQIHKSNGAGPWLNENPLLCIQKGLSMLRRSTKICPDNPVAWYAGGGENACTNERSIRVSRDRVNLAKWLFSKRETPINRETHTSIDILIRPTSEGSYNKFYSFSHLCSFVDLIRISNGEALLRVPSSATQHASSLPASTSPGAVSSEIGEVQRDEKVTVVEEELYNACNHFTVYCIEKAENTNFMLEKARFTNVKDIRGNRLDRCILHAKNATCGVNAKALRGVVPC